MVGCLKLGMMSFCSLMLCKRSQRGQFDKGDVKERLGNADSFGGDDPKASSNLQRNWVRWCFGSSVKKLVGPADFCLKV